MTTSSSPKVDSEFDEAATITEKGVGKDFEGGGILPETHDVFSEADSGIDPVYQAKARVINDALQEIGMGKYQWLLFVVTGFGWFS
ncbi:hypothetical protein BC835DRAFT_1421315 [Cytidiella melzeri]|nr:hypothetical protein BC835DRAFT_1421315 [Cytidiella melzeri]